MTGAASRMGKGPRTCAGHLYGGIERFYSRRGGCAGTKPRGELRRVSPEKSRDRRGRTLAPGRFFRRAGGDRGGRRFVRLVEVHAARVAGRAGRRGAVARSPILVARRTRLALGSAP